MDKASHYVELMREQEGTPLTNREDEDKDLYYLDKYVMRDKGGNPIPDIVNITLNDLAVFAHNIIAGLGKVTQQVVVETEDKNLDTAYIEDFQKAYLNTANARLMRSGRGLIEPFFDEQLCIRGRAAFRCLTSIEDGILIPNVTPIDTRFFPHELGVDGLEWGAAKYPRSKSEIARDYPGETISGSSAIITDLWDKEVNITWIGGKKVREEENKYGYPPFGFQVVSLGSMLWDADSEKHQGESVYFLVREIFPELNRLASIMASINLKKLKAALLWKTKEGKGATPPKHETLTGMSAVTSMDIDERIDPVLIAEVERSAMMLHNLLESRMQRGTLSSFDLGTFTFPMSAIALLEIGEGRDQIQLPRLNTKSWLKQALAEMLTRQTIALEFPSVELGTPGHRRSFDIGKLKGEYETTYKYFVKSPKMDIARITMANSAGELIPDKAKRREILEREDPDGDEKQLRWEEMERLSPAIKIYRDICSLQDIPPDPDFESELLSAQLGMTLEQILAGQLPQIPEPGSAPAPMIPLMTGAGGGRSSARKAADLQATPREEGGG